MQPDALVQDYLGRLEAASWPLAADRRGELIGDVREHIDAALAEAGRRDEITTRNVLERLGAPEEIVAAEVDSERGRGAGWTRPPDASRTDSRWGPLEIAAIGFLTIGAVALPFFGPIVGLMLVWLSGRWTTRQKAVATLLAVAVIITLPVLLIAVASGTDGQIVQELNQ
jgi:uncharacterized membrane protein